MKKIRVILGLLCMVFLAGCGKEQKEDEMDSVYQVYMVQKDENKVDSRQVRLDAKDDEECIELLLAELKSVPEDTAYKSAISETFNLNEYSFSDSLLTLDFDTGYYDQTPSGEVLARAAIVRTLCQVDSVKYVNITVAGASIENASHVPIGLMTADQFVDNAGKEINAYEKASLILYFADETGRHLEAHSVECYYNSNISLDKLVVEQLIKGPDEAGEKDGFPVLPKTTTVLSVATQDGVCYVNLGGDISIRMSEVLPTTTIYAIVNSLVELPDVNKVQIAINGESNLLFMDDVDLSQNLERNLELLFDAQ